jgi:hypothetical protein
MALFAKKNPVQKLEADLDGLKARALLLNTKRDAARSALDDAIAARQAHLLDGDIDDAKAATTLQARVDTATSELAGFDTAIAESQARINAAELALTAEAWRIKCEADAKALGAVVAGLEGKFGPWLDATRAIAADLESLNGHTYQPAPLAAFFRHTAGEAEFALRMTLDELARSIPAVAAGMMTVKIGVEQPEPVAATPAPARKDIFEYTEHPRNPGFRVPGAAAFHKE